MFDRAKEIAKSQGKEEDRKTILGIFQSFFKEWPIIFNYKNGISKFKREIEIATRKDDS